MERLATTARADRFWLPASRNSRVRRRRGVPVSPPTRVSIILIAACVMASSLGCTSPYTGVYRLPGKFAPCSIAGELGVALRPFGAPSRPDDRLDGGVSWLLNGRRSESQFETLSGSDSIVVVSCFPNAVTVRDVINQEETPFVRAVRNAIENVLKSIGIANPKCEQTFDPLS